MMTRNIQYWFNGIKRPSFTVFRRKQLSKILSNIFERDISEIEKLLPNGGFELVKSSGIDIKLE